MGTRVMNEFSNDPSFSANNGTDNPSSRLRRDLNASNLVGFDGEGARFQPVAITPSQPQDYGNGPQSPHIGNSLEYYFCIGYILKCTM